MKRTFRNIIKYSFINSWGLAKAISSELYTLYRNFVRLGYCQYSIEIKELEYYAIQISYNVCTRIPKEYYKGTFQNFE